MNALCSSQNLSKPPSPLPPLSKGRWIADKQKALKSRYAMRYIKHRYIPSLLSARRWGLSPVRTIITNPVLSLAPHYPNFKFRTKGATTIIHYSFFIIHCPFHTAADVHANHLKIRIFSISSRSSSPSKPANSSLFSPYTHL